jgi:hypothetical protein
VFSTDIPYLTARDMNVAGNVSISILPGRDKGVAFPYPVRDKMLVEKLIATHFLRAVRYAM